MQYSKKIASVTLLLKSYNVPLSAKAANRALVQMGILENKKRPSTAKPGELRTFRQLTKKGLAFGVNTKNHACPTEITPRFDLYKFGTLAGALTTFAQQTQI